LVSLVNVADVAEAATYTGVPAVEPAFGVALQPVIVLPPLLAGADHVTTARAVAGLAVTLCGALGALGAAGTTAFDCADSGPWPIGFEAVTVNVV
jgi:hypothetical protein